MLTAVFSLALGLEATTAVCNVIYAALINPCPYREVERIVRLTVEDELGPGDWIGMNARSALLSGW